MIYNVIFDLDGVLFDGCRLHAELFLEAVGTLCPDKRPTAEYHDTHLNSLSTRQKLKMLGIDSETSEKIYALKQDLTANKISAYLKKDKQIIRMCGDLVRMGYNIFCVSNSIRATVEACLSGMGIKQCFSGIVSNEDTVEAKPSPQPYLTLYRICNLEPKECIIFEDSQHGIASARASGGHVIPVLNCQDISLVKVLAAIESIEKP